MKLDGIKNIYILGDIHLGIKNGSIEWFKIQWDFFHNFFIPKIKELGFDHKTDILIQTGDWNHVRESTNVRISNESRKLFSMLSDVFKRGVYIILGNHDVYYKDRTDINSLKEVPILYDNIKIYETPGVLNINGNHKFLMMPWEHDINKLAEKVNKQVGKSDYMICHADIKDFRLNKWTKIDKGLTKADIKIFKKVYSGHIHIRQDNKNVTYVGTPYQLDRGDWNNIKGFYKLNVEENKIKEKFYENTYSPRFIKVNATDVLNMSVSKASEVFNNNFVDIMISNNLAKVLPINDFIDLFNESEHRNIEFYPYTTDESASERTEGESYEYNIFDIACDYLEKNNISGILHNNVFEKFKGLYDQLKDINKYHE